MFGGARTVLRRPTRPGDFKRFLYLRWRFTQGLRGEPLCRAKDRFEKAAIGPFSGDLEGSLKSHPRKKRVSIKPARIEDVLNLRLNVYEG